MAQVTDAVGGLAHGVARHEVFEPVGARKGRRGGHHELVVAEPVGGQIRHRALGKARFARNEPGQGVGLVVAVAQKLPHGFAGNIEGPQDQGEVKDGLAAVLQQDAPVGQQGGDHRAFVGHDAPVADDLHGALTPGKEALAGLLGGFGHGPLAVARVL